MTGSAPTAAAYSLLACHSCGFLAKMGTDRSGGRLPCPRCGVTLHGRKPNSLGRTWALLLAAYIFYIPANLFPITKVYSLGTTQADTIISGVVFFLLSGSWPIALVIFVASILVPFLKMVILTFLLVSVQRKWRWKPEERTRLYRFIEAIGRWSMVDIYVVTILVALVRFDSLADIHAGPAIFYFAAVVVLTILAAESFDPRLIWDNLEPDND